MSPVKRSVCRVVFHPLSLALATAVTLPPDAMAAGPVLADGTSETIRTDTYNSDADNRPVLQARNGGSITGIGTITVESTHAGAHAAVADGGS